MSEFKGTPGPWSWVTGNNGYYYELKGADGNCIHSDGSAAGEYSPDIDINSPNAKLIAAAPDLLEALKAVVAIADRDTDVFNAAKAAIAKATGVDAMIKARG